MGIQQKKFSEVVSVINISKHKPRDVILIHGLFATPGFWIPALPLLRDFSVTLVGVNYSAIFLEYEYKKIYAQVDQISLDLNKIVHGKGYVIAHSLGSIFFCGTEILRLPTFSMAPPVSVSNRTFSFDDFFEGAQIKSNEKMVAVGENAISYLSESCFEDAIVGRASRFYPLNDKVFPAASREKIETYPGGHFEVAQGISSILRYIDAK